MQLLKMLWQLYRTKRKPLPWQALGGIPNKKQFYCNIFRRFSKEGMVKKWNIYQYQRMPDYGEVQNAM